MTQDDAQKIRAQWLMNGRPPCEHEYLELERTALGYLTGNYLCRTCGAFVTEKPPTSPS